MTEHKKAIIREATVPDLRRMVKLIEQLIRKERELGGTDVVEDEAVLNKALTEYLAEALFRSDAKIFLIEKSGNPVGIFICEIEQRPPFNVHRRVCNIWIMYAKKNPVYIKRIFNEMESWARTKGCSIIRGGVLMKNERVHRLLKALGCRETHITFEKEV